MAGAVQEPVALRRAPPNEGGPAVPNNIALGLSLVDPTGLLILATTATCLALGLGAHLFARSRYAGLERDLEESAAAHRRFAHRVLNDIVRDAREAAARSREPNTQAIIEEHFQSGLRPLLFAERFARAATGLVIILGLLGTFYGLTSSIGKLVHLVAGDGGPVADVAQGVTTGLSQALSGMAVAFSNSLVGIASAVVLTIVGVLSSVTDRRVALMVRIETYLDRLLASSAPLSRSGAGEGSVAEFSASVERLEATVARFESALLAFSTSTRDFTEFNAHLKDNVQRMSLTFGDLSETLKGELVALKRGGGR
jgi:hypothetical protein